MVDLVQWLTAQLDEDERTARRAGDSFRQIGETGVIVATEGDRAEECASANWAGVAEHIVAWDPSRVLREIDAKRQTLAECAAAETEMDQASRDRDTARYNSVRAEWQVLKRIIRRDAAVYADRPGFREEWAP